MSSRPQLVQWETLDEVYAHTVASTMARTNIRAVCTLSDLGMLVNIRWNMMPASKPLSPFLLSPACLRFPPRRNRCRKKSAIQGSVRTLASTAQTLSAPRNRSTNFSRSFLLTWAPPSRAGEAHAVENAAFIVGGPTGNTPDRRRWPSLLGRVVMS